MGTMTRQDLQTVTEMAKNKIIERLVTKYDVQVVCDNARDKILEAISAAQIENQSTFRQMNAQADQSWRKVVAMEAQLASLRREMQDLQRAVNKLADLMGASKNAQASPEPLSFPVK